MAEAHRLSRRDLLKRVGIIGAAAATHGGLDAPVEAAGIPSPESQASPATQTPPASESFETLTAAESDALEAIVRRIIPTDENGPGAGEARAAHYIDRALGGALASSRAAYLSGLAAMDNYAKASKGAPFAKLSAKDQDAVLSDMENNIARGFSPDSSAFFNLLRSHTLQGTFCDPYYGGNANFVGWDLIGYPGVRTFVTANEQRMGVPVEPARKSAYDYPMFSKGTSHDD